MTDWAWGTDVSTKAIDIAHFSPGHAPAFHTIEIPPGATGAARLMRARRALIRELAPMANGPHAPTVVGVELPGNPRGADFRLWAIAAIALEVYAEVFGCPIFELSTGTWKKEAVGHGNATKEKVAEWAFEFVGVRTNRQDHLDALGVAVTVSKWWRTSPGGRPGA